MADCSLEEELTDPSERVMHPFGNGKGHSLRVKDMESKFLNPGVHFEREAASKRENEDPGRKTCPF